MAVTLESTAIKRWRGLSTDDKPRFAGEDETPVAVGSVFTEIDTGHRYVWGGSWPWVRQAQTIDTAFMEFNDLLRDILAVVTATHNGNEEHLWEEEVPIDTF